MTLKIFSIMTPFLLLLLLSSNIKMTYVFLFVCSLCCSLIVFTGQPHICLYIVVVAVVCLYVFLCLSLHVLHCISVCVCSCVCARACPACVSLYFSLYLCSCHCIVTGSTMEQNSNRPQERLGGRGESEGQERGKKTWRKKTAIWSDFS